MSSSVSTNAAEGPVKLIDAIGLTLRNAPIPDQLLAYSDCLNNESPDDEMMLGWAFKMRCYAQLGQFPDAQHSRRKAREHYAAHLGLKADVLEQYLADTSYIEEEIGLTDATEHPWLYYLLHESTFSTSLYMLIGDSDEERAGHAMRAWASFGDDQTLLRKVLAVLHVRAKRYQVAVAIIEGILRSRDYQSAEFTADLYLGQYWLSFIAGECYKALGDRGGAMNRWQVARSFEMWRTIDPEAYGILVSSWVEKAKDALRAEGITLPTWESSQTSTQHLAAAWQWMLRAEVEVEGLNLYDLATKLKDPENDFKKYTSAADQQMRMVEKLDPFIRVEVDTPNDGGKRWISYVLVKGVILFYWGLVYACVDDFRSALVWFNQSLALQPTRGCYFWLGFTYQAQGAMNEAREAYQIAIAPQTDFIDVFEDENERENMEAMVNCVLNEF
jgi:tetratricopeptide (TPR) repeat protein